MSSKKRNFKSKESTITCHACKKVMLQQNFSTHMRNIHNSNETRDLSQRSIAAMFISAKRPRAEQAQSPDINVEDEQLDSFTRSSCSGEVTENLELGEMQDPNQRLNIFTDDCNKESSITDADVTSIVVDDLTTFMKAKLKIDQNQQKQACWKAKFAV